MWGLSHFTLGPQPSMRGKVSDMAPYMSHYIYYTAKAFMLVLHCIIANVLQHLASGIQSTLMIGNKLDGSTGSYRAAPEAVPGSKASRPLGQSRYISNQEQALHNGARTARAETGLPGGVSKAGAS